MSQRRPQYDITNVFRSYLQNRYKERADLNHEMTDAIRDHAEPKLVLAEVLQNCVDHNLAQTDTLLLAMNYGLVLGILLEKDRAERMRKVS